MKKLIVISSAVSCTSARTLAKELECPWENPYDTGNRDFSEYEHVIKYGFSRPIKANHVFNTAAAVQAAINKLDVYKAFKPDGFCVEFTGDPKEALKWIKDGHKIVARNDLYGSHGDGVFILDGDKEFNNTPAILWTKYIPHTHEFRVNLWRDEVISIYDKPEVKGEFRFILYKGQEKQQQLVDMAAAVYKKIGLDWCGLDVLCDKKGNLTLLEINSGPILFPYTMRKLVERIKKAI